MNALSEFSGLGVDRFLGFHPDQVAVGAICNGAVNTALCTTLKGVGVGWMYG